MKPESRAALLKAQAALDEAYLTCLREAVEEPTTEKRAKIANAICHLPEFAKQIAELVDPKPKSTWDFGQMGGGVLGLQQADQRLYTQGGGIVKDTAAW